VRDPQQENSMILVGQYDSPFVRRVGVTLHLYGMPFTRNAISVFTDAGEMALINPLVRIPSLILDSGETLIDSAAILDTLDEMVGPSRALTPASGAARRRVLKATAMAAGAMDKAGAWVYERHFHPPGQRCNQLSGGYGVNSPSRAVRVRCAAPGLFSVPFADRPFRCRRAMLRVDPHASCRYIRRRLEFHTRRGAAQPGPFCVTICRHDSGSDSLRTCKSASRHPLSVRYFHICHSGIAAGRNLW
jgi:glutathione S-transferase